MSRNSMDFNGKVALVTGAASGMGLATAQAFAEAGAAVVLAEHVKSGSRVNAVNPGLIDTQIGRDVLSGDERAYADLAEHVPMGRAGRPDEIARQYCGFAVPERVMWWVRPSPWMAE